MTAIAQRPPNRAEAIGTPRIAQQRDETACRREIGSTPCLPIHVDSRNCPIERRDHKNGALSHKNRRRFNVRMHTIESGDDCPYSEDQSSIFLPQIEIPIELIGGKAHQPRPDHFGGHSQL